MNKIEVTELSKGERQFLGRKGISGAEWDEMPAEHQRKWKREMKSPQKADHDNHPDKHFNYN